MFSKILIANRGEIACRVIRTARRLGVKTIAVYSEADDDALHVALADEAYPIGPAPAAESYLDGQRILAVARHSGAEAVHPGYGFLSENAGFAAACTKAGMVFIGPPASAIRAMGDKAAAKRLMAKAGVPLVPGYDGANQHPAILADAANRLGYPVLIKAAAGGGGRGMRVVDAVAGFGEAAASAKREAKAAFGDGRLILERYLPRARHVEVQIFADSQGNFVHLFTRDCSLQRRHQKVIEEAPAPDLPPRLRAALHEAALKAARAVRYRGAGTVEFIVADGKAYFIEMNTRLQVEHPVTEIVTGFDLVEWQLRVAVGERLPRRQKAIKLRGHAVEARLYAEDPAAGFLPSTGTLGRLRFPPPAKDLRIETGLRQGDRVTEFYDPMIAKLAAWGRHRPAALARLAEALRETRVLGVQTNRDLLLRLVTQRPFVKGPADTGYIARHWAKLRPGPAPDAALAAAALSRLVVPLTPVRGGDGFSPWRLKDGWRIEGGSAQEFRFVEGGRERRVALRFGRAGLMLDFGQRRVPALAWKLDDGDLAFELGRLHFHASVSWHGAGVQIALAEGIFQLDLAAPKAARASAAALAGRVVAPMSGKIGALHVAPGERVRSGQILLVLEAMKMEHALSAPADGIVAGIAGGVGETVEAGAELLVLAPLAAKEKK
ncbi:MAG TPA: biotin carboxylase N-terminal domain-containing protein [Stellaceae bacterium]|nr:biotin carboxylase N-terminal domain-containing protein [Stellaceae bacterium]